MADTGVFAFFETFIGQSRAREEEKEAAPSKIPMALSSARRNGRVAVTAYIKHVGDMAPDERRAVLEQGGASMFFPANYRLQQVTAPFRSSGGANSWAHNAIVFKDRAMGRYFDEWWGVKNTEVELFAPADSRTHVALGEGQGAGVPLRGFVDYWCRRRADGRMAIVDLKTSGVGDRALADIANNLKYVQQLRVYALLARWLLLDDRYTPRCYIAALNYRSSTCFQLFQIVFADDPRTIEQAVNVAHNPDAVIPRVEQVK